MATSALPDPMIWRKRSWISLCAFGTGALSLNEVITKVKEVWGLTLKMTARVSDRANQRGNPTSSAPCGHHVMSR